MPRPSGMHDDAGASAVEFALLLPVFALLVFGIVSAGIGFTHKIAITQAAREGSRYGATLPTTVGIDTWLQNVRDAAVGAAGDDFTDGSPSICVAYIAGDGSTQATRQLQQNMPGGAPIYTDGQPCFSDGRSDTRVQVEMKRTTDWNLLLTDTTIGLDSKSVSRYER